MIIALLFSMILGGALLLMLPLSRWRAILVVGLYIGLMGLVFWGGLSIYGRPKPIWIEIGPWEKVQIISAVPIENEVIYVWLASTDSVEPRAYTLPWSQKSAQQLQDAMNKANADGTVVEMVMNTGDEDGEPMFYAQPQPASPPKNYEAPKQTFQLPNH